MEEIKGLTIDQLEVGQKASFTKTVTEADVYNYAGVSGDFNPAHMNEEYAKNTAFKTRIAHGITATITVEELIKEKNRAILKTVCTNQDGDVVVEGTAKVMPPK